MPDAPDAELSEAIVAWTGHGQTTRPSRDPRRLADIIGDAAAARLLPRLRELEDDFYATDAVHRASDLKEIGELAAVDFARKHHEISRDAIEALAWCYTFDFK